LRSWAATEEGPDAVASAPCCLLLLLLLLLLLPAGMCHSDLHTIKGDWGPAKYPVVPG
jgi:hypothetical protein